MNVVRTFFGKTRHSELNNLRPCVVDWTYMTANGLPSGVWLLNELTRVTSASEIRYQYCSFWKSFVREQFIWIQHSKITLRTTLANLNNSQIHFLTSVISVRRFFRKDETKEHLISGVCSRPHKGEMHKSVFCIWRNYWPATRRIFVGGGHVTFKSRDHHLSSTRTRNQ